VTIPRTLGLDVGDKTIGVAVSDGLGLTAQGVEVVARKNIKLDLARLKELIETLEVQQVVVGLPRSLNNTLGPQAEKVEHFVTQLKKKIEIPVIMVDERFSTSIAQRSMLEGDLSRRKRKQVVDRLAAQVILQGYLDRMHRQHDG